MLLKVKVEDLEKDEVMVALRDKAPLEQVINNISLEDNKSKNNRYNNHSNHNNYNNKPNRRNNNGNNRYNNKRNNRPEKKHNSEISSMKICLKIIRNWK